MIANVMLTSLASTLCELAGYSAGLGETDFHVDVIVNPAAGALRRIRTVRSYLDVLWSYVTGLQSVGRKRKPLRQGIYLTEYAGHGRQIARELLSNLSAHPNDRRRLIITAGGDGTSLEVCSSLVEADPSLLDRIRVFRLPFGTGNDGADAHTLSDSCEILLGPHGTAKTGAVRVKPRGMEPFYSFNIASIGLDAFVVDLTNRLKNVIPGDFYRHMVDVATVFYEPIYGIRPMCIELSRDDGSRETLEDDYILFLTGVSGRRTYGGNKRILPGDENVCAVRTASLSRKLEIKGLFYTGEHRDLPEVDLRTARRAVVHYDRRIPLQIDGEAIWLQPENFPLSFEVIDPVIPILY
jgi:diacylglycerol kinase family enzyme